MGKSKHNNDRIVYFFQKITVAYQVDTVLILTCQILKMQENKQ
jgi:hypothetical protein